jgi:hypothetical protein
VRFLLNGFATALVTFFLTCILRFALLKALRHPAQIKIPETEYDNLFVVFPKSDGPPTVLPLRY